MLRHLRGAARPQTYHQSRVSVQLRFLRCAQPMPSTHPHLMAPGEVTPGIAGSEYAERRKNLAASLPAGSIAIFPSAPFAYMSHDVPFPLFQDTEMLYLCGLQEHSSFLACVKPANASMAARWHLFVRPSNAAEELWDGARAGIEGAQEVFLPEGAAHDIGKAAHVLGSELSSSGDAAISHLFYAPRSNPEINAKLRPVLTEGAPARLSPRPVQRLVHTLRVRKSAAEIELMRRSGVVGAEAMRSTMLGSMHATTAGLTEGALAAQFEFECKLAGAERLAYPCVVAGGANATTLHYMHNNAVLDPTKLLLMDAGSSLHGYCSDVTRTWPLGGTYTDAQRAVYEAVLDVNERIIDMCVADGRTTLTSLHRHSLQWTLEHLIRLGIIARDDKRAGARCQKYFPHALGHWLGLDVHDTPSIESSQPLEAGMVITVEPGLYLPADDFEVPAPFRGIGIRIEDDVLIRADGAAPEVLSAAAPKQVDAVEALLSTAG